MQQVLFENHSAFEGWTVLGGHTIWRLQKEKKASSTITTKAFSLR
jgi:hypothetical protein